MTIAPYGTWTSPITSDSVVAGAVRLGEVVLDSDAIYWIESRPEDGGSAIVVRHSNDRTYSDLLRPGFSARSRVNEYGGGAFTVVDGDAVFVNWSDQNIYRAEDRVPTPLTKMTGHAFGDLVFDRHRSRIVAVMESESANTLEPVTTIAAVSSNAGGSCQAPTVLVTGADFYAHARFSADGRQMSWLQWRHPNMPWDGCELWIGQCNEAGLIEHSQLIAGGPAESIAQPEWTPNGDLVFVSDRTGWWNLYRFNQGSVSSILLREAEYAAPLWSLSTTHYAVLNGDRLLAAFTSESTWYLEFVDIQSGTSVPVPLPSTYISNVVANERYAVFHASSPIEPTALVRLDLATKRTAVLRRSLPQQPQRAYVSVPGAVTFPSVDGRNAHGFFYPPHNQDFQAPESERPPLIVVSHGGPTDATSASYSGRIQYWTSRGFSVFDVNYAGSSGYGRSYREALNGAWGIADVDDLVYGAMHLVQEGLVDSERLIIRGSSAAGFTTLATLAFRDAFHIGVSLYGISDLEALTRDTHKFESHYLETLVGPYPESAETYRQRSPIYHTESINSAVLIMQGADDKVVPPAQSEQMFDALKAGSQPVAYLLFEGEGHGFRKAANIKRALEAELYFYGAILNLELPEKIEPIVIDNLSV